MRVLLSAFACHPHQGSEPGIGWGWSTTLSATHDVTVITDICNQEAIERTGGFVGRFVYVDSHPFRFLLRLSRLGEYAYYYLWQMAAYSLARRVHRERPFDLAHHVTLATDKLPSFLCLLPIPFIWGSIGGAERIPASVARDMTLSWFERLRSKFHGAWRHIPGVPLTFRRAAIIIVSNETTLRSIPERYRSKCHVLSNMSLLDTGPEPNVRMRGAGGRILYVGRLESRKGVEFLIRAVATIPLTQSWSLRIVGDGPQRSFLESLASDLGINSRIEFTGAVTRSDLAEFYSAADLFCFPSVRDSGGTAIIEAMAAGLPIVCFNLGGPVELVPSDCGTLVEPAGYRETVAKLAAAIEGLLRSPELRLRKGVAARKHAVSTHTWAAKAIRIESLYARVADHRSRHTCADSAKHEMWRVVPPPVEDDRASRSDNG